ncbi:MAG: AMP-binding protein [Defluviitaleaceae bacterium]|nr:AMP-binding protein [Defluviitaleaceae bacterium]
MVCRSFDEMVRTGYEFKDSSVYEKIDGRYVGRTFAELYSDVWALSEKLLDMGLENKSIMLYGKNSYNWLVVYLAVITYVGVIVPIDKEWKARDIENVLSDTQIDCIFCTDCLKCYLNSIKAPVINLENEASALISQGRSLGTVRRKCAESPSRICSIMFTSGTTAKPKKIELSEKNLWANGFELEKLVTVSASDRYMLSLPLSHIAPVLASFIYPMSMGASLYIPSSFKEMAEDLKLIRPTVFYGVPKIFEEIWRAIPLDKKQRLRKGILLSNFLRRLGIDKRKGIFAELHNSLGGAVRFAYSGAVSLDSRLVRSFEDMGLTILQAYGMTESAAIISFDSINDYRLGSVGRVLPNLAYKIIDRDSNGVGEICVRGDSIAACAVAGDGYLHTGDLGYIDKDGYLFLVGRKKRLIKLSNAKNVYPDELEELLLHSTDIKQALVYEENGRISASVVSDCGIAVVEEFVGRLNKTLPRYKQIRQVRVVGSLSEKL